MVLAGNGWRWGLYICDITNTYLKAQFLKTGCLYFSMDWAFWYFHSIYIAPRPAIYLKETWESHFLQYMTFNGEKIILTVRKCKDADCNNRACVLFFYGEHATVEEIKLWMSGRFFCIDCLNVFGFSGLLSVSPCPWRAPAGAKRSAWERSNQPVTNQPLLQLVFHLDNASLLS